MHRNHLAFGCALVACLWLTGCDDDETPDPDGGEAGAGQGGGAPELPPTSDKAQVKLKAGLRFRNDVAQSLELEDDYCFELGLVDCAAVHIIIMGGSDAFGSGLYEPLPETTATSPLGFDRLALAGCIARADRDLAEGAQPVIFSDLPIEDGKLSDPQAAEVSEVIVRLYQRTLNREPTGIEKTALLGLYDTVEAKGGAAPARDWAVLGCFAVMTSMENVFY